MFKKKKASKDDKIMDSLLNFNGQNYSTENNFNVVNPDDYFVIKNDFQEGSANQSAIGRNSVVNYQNKYVSTGKRLASSEVVDISSFTKKKEVEVVDDTKKEENLEVKTEENQEPEEDIFSFFDQKDGEEEDLFGDDFWSFGETDVKDSVKEEIKEEAKEEKDLKVVEPVPEITLPPKPVAPKKPRKKKRAIDIDIISGGTGGDII